MTPLASGARRWIKTIDRILECIHVIGEDGAKLTTVVTLNHNLEPREYAAALRRAALYFDKVGLESK